MQMWMQSRTRLPFRDATAAGIERERESYSRRVWIALLRGVEGGAVLYKYIQTAAGSDSTAQHATGIPVGL